MYGEIYDGKGEFGLTKLNEKKKGWQFLAELYCSAAVGSTMIYAQGWLSPPMTVKGKNTRKNGLFMANNGEEVLLGQGCFGVVFG